MPEERVLDQPLTGVLDGLGSTPVGGRVRTFVGARGTRRRRRVIVLAVVLVVVFSGGLATALTLRHLDRQYGPLEPGSFGGPYRDRGFAYSKDGSSYQLAAAPNATAQLIASLANRGAHSVKVTSIETDQVATKIQWSVYRTVQAGSVSGIDTPWRAFPAVVPAHGTIRLLITIHHPSDCKLHPTDTGLSKSPYLGTHWVHWQSLLHDHRTLIGLRLEGDQGIEVC
jgi:hypothetical protein